MKKLLIALGLFATIGLTSGVALNRGYVQVRAEDESSEIVEETSEESSEEIVSEEIESITEETPEEEDGFFDKLSQGAKDFLIVAKEVLNQPIVIGGVSVSLGAILIWVIGKLISSLGKKKVNDIIKQLEELGKKTKDSVSKKDYNALASQVNELVEIAKVLADGTRNIKVKEKAQELLKEFEPIIQDNKEFAIEETKKVVEDGKQQVDKTAHDIVGIVNKD